MKKLFFLAIVFCCIGAIEPNDEKKVYLFFDKSSNKMHSYEIEGGNIVDENFYLKEQNKDGIKFYIKGELFEYKYELNRLDTCSTRDLKKIKYSKIMDLKKEVDRVNLLYPYKVFPNLFIVERFNDTTFVKYKVKWKYYIK